jgi:predicted Zn-dependent protease
MRCLPLVVAAVAVLALAGPASAQGRVYGVVKSTDGKPIKGATITARNPNASPREFTATSDDRGRWTMMGLRSGAWLFTAEAPGFEGMGGTANVRTIGAPNPPLEFTLAPAVPPGPPGLGRDIQSQLRAAEELRNSGQFDKAIATYSAIKATNPALTTINLVLGTVYRQKAAAEPTEQARQAALEKAMAAFQEMLAVDPRHERARLEYGLAQMQAGRVDDAEATLKAIVADGTTLPDVYHNLAEIKFSTGDLDGAEALFTRALDLAPTWQQPRLKLALIAFKRDDRSRAIALFEEIIAADPNAPEAAQAKTFLGELRK